MKKIVSLLLALSFILLAAVACSGQKGKYAYDLSDYIELGEYKNLPATATDTRVTDEAVRRQVESSISYYSRKVEVVGRPADVGDTANIDYMGYVEGISEQSITHRNVDVILGLYEYPEEFETAIIGMNAGESRFVEITFPDDFDEYPEYAGKTAEISIYLNSVCEVEEPEYTDDFVKAYLYHDSIADYEEAVRAALEKQHESGFYKIVSQQIWQTIVDNATVKKYPEAEVKYYYDGLVGNVNDYVTELELDFDAFVNANFEMTAEEFYDYAKTYSEEKVKEEMVVHAIAKAEGITLTDEEYKTLGEEYAKTVAGVESLAKLEEEYSRDEISEVLLGDKVKKAVADLADITWTKAD